jgi:hybrid cluster-associated redox disulfide protein
MKKIVITKDMIIDDVLKLDKSLGDVFMGFGMHCVFCHLGLEETVEEASLVHYVDTDFLVKKLNEVYNEKHPENK